MEKYFDINNPGYSIKCKLYCDAPREIDNCVIFLHGFGGHKDNKAAMRFAENVHSKMKRSAVLTFDWPCHGKDVRKKLTLSDCDTYLSMVLDHVTNEIKAKNIFAYATSFGGYLTLKYISEHGNPFKKIALRAPAVTMYYSMQERVMTPENQAALAKGKEALVGFDRLIKIDNDFISELKSFDVTEKEFIDFADDIIIIQGVQDEIIPEEKVRDFCEDNVLEYIPVEGADHRFQNLDLLKLAHSHIIQYFIDAL